MAEAKIVVSAVDQTKAAIDSAKRNLSSLSEMATSMASRMGTLGVAVGAAFSAGSLMSVIDMLDKLDDMAEKTGVSVESLSRLRYAGESVGTTQEQLAVGLTKLTRLMGEAAGGNDQAALTFKTLGVEIANADGSLRGTDQVLSDVAQRFSGWDNGAAKAAIAMKVFGKSGEDMIPMLNLGADGIQSMGEQAEKLGGIFSGDVAKAAADFNDNLTQIRFGTEAAKVQIAASLLPTLNELAKAMVDVRSNGSSMSGMLGDGLATVLRTTAVLGMNVAYVLRETGTELGGLAAQAAAVMRLDFQGAAAIGQMMRDDSAKARKDIDEGSARILGLRTITQQAGVNPGDPKKPAPTIPDKTGNKPAKTPDHFADNFINQLITEYANLSGEMSKTEEVTRKLDTATEKFSSAQRQIILDIAGQIDARKADIEWMQQQSASEADYRAARQASSDEVVAAMGDINAFTDAIRLETNVLELQANMRGRATSEVQAEVAVLRIRADLQDRIQKIQDSSIPDSLKELEISRLRTAAAQSEVNAQGLAANGFADYLSSMGTEADRMANTVSGGFKSMEDALVSFTKTGKLDFANMADSIISDLVRIAVQQSVTRPIAGFLGSFFADGGVMSSKGALPLNTYASGGIANSPQMAIFGEGRMNEAFVPLPDGKSIPVNLQGGSGSITINQPLVINAPNAGPETVAQIQAMMPSFIAANSRVVEGIVRQAMARNGGRFK